MTELSTQIARRINDHISKRLDCSTSPQVDVIESIIETELDPVMDVIRRLAKIDPMVADTDGDPDVVECIFCGIDRDAAEFAHDSTACAWFQARKIVGEENV